ncbi:MAG: N-acetylneuraminate synthase [Candidatus Omnitrophota bacterium]
MVKGIWKKIIDPQYTFIIAEAGVNHNGNISLAKQLINRAVDAGADAVKFQTFKAECVVSDKAPKADYQKQATGVKQSQLDMVRRLELSQNAYRQLYAYCQKKNIAFLSTPFDEASVDFLDGIGMEVFKIPSGEITNFPFIEYIAGKGKPIIMSTGMATLDEIKKAVQVIKKAKNYNYALLHCVSSYPTDYAEVNLKAIITMRDVFKVPIGFSDHTLGIDISPAAVAMGARIIEKHFTIKKKYEGPDHSFSLEPRQLKGFIKGIRHISVALGTGEKKPSKSELPIAAIARRSLVAACDIKKGTIISDGFIAIKRPGTGIPPVMKQRLIGRTAKVNILKDSIISFKMLK